MDLDIVFRRDTLLFALADDPEEVRRSELFAVYVQILADVLDESLLVSRIVDGKVLTVAQDICVGSEDPEACRVESEDPHVDAFSHQVFYSFAHLARRLVRKGHSQHVVWVDAFFSYHVCDAVGHGAGLAASCPRQNEERSFCVHGRFSLLVVKFIEIFHSFVLVLI